MSFAHAAALVVLVLVPVRLMGQADPGRPNPYYASRSDLEAKAAAAESLMGAATAPALREARRAEAWLLRERLRVGDFQPGDRIVLTVDGQPTMSDTLTVSGRRTVSITDVPEVSLFGVLRVELQSHLIREIGKLVRDPRVHVIPLMRVSLLGRVGRPGFYAFPADALLSDVIMAAGGPALDADLSKTMIRRGSEALLEPQQVAVALRDGMTLDQLDVRAGDEIVVGAMRQRSSMREILRTVALAVSLTATIIALATR